ncbi:pyridine nucleotide-disulfide oxidoreductase [Alteribacter lacisalsi]|uniref:Pyridine nucleotide-disulfide oxidoreductase n=1 Tax=Alteribacter lacisalsi TaxID=2045244 RepID=A0A2W0H5Y7_9BACI|nr:FAD-dependent oxidoreductase [Alteribacter lacisalsi]PYZ97264.1 pyridine nucleotide-disulfide oxidoreductase [Alteribacter lacisalsi]
MKRLVLIGGGHANLGVIRRLGRERPEQVRCILISADDFQYYSGMFSGYSEGLYNKEELRIDLADFCRRNGADFICAKAEFIDRHARQVMTTSGPAAYDFVSINTGSLVKTEVPGASRYSLSVKPSYIFPDAVQRLREAANPVIAGGGAAGVELAFSLAAWRKSHGYYGQGVTLLTKGTVLGGHKSGARKVRDLMKKKQIRLLEHTGAEEVADGSVVTGSGAVSYSELLWLTGPKAGDFAVNSALTSDRQGFLLVTDTLQAVNDPDVFGAGDCATMMSYPELPKNGVYAVRQAGILYDNILARAKGKTLSRFRPQKRYLAILSTGGKTGLCLYGKAALQGKWAWKLKSRIDRKFMKTMRC